MNIFSILPKNSWKIEIGLFHMKTRVCLKFFVHSCRTSEESRMKFFVTIVSSWELLVVVTKNSILVATRVLDQTLLENEMGRLNKHRISGREFY